MEDLKRIGYIQIFQNNWGLFTCKCWVHL